MSSTTVHGIGSQSVSPAAVLDQAGMRRALTRIAHEIVEHHPGPEPLVLMGMQTRGVPLAQRLALQIEAIDGRRIPAGAIDNSLYRDDLARRSTARIQPSRIPGDIDGSVIVLVDDVLYTGRSIRAALDALIDYGRPAAIELAVLIDPRPPRTADSPRLRRQEHPHAPRRRCARAPPRGRRPRRRDRSSGSPQPVPD